MNLLHRPAALDTARYMSGFGNGFETEALPGALPVGRNSPQRCAYGLYAEQLSGSPFTAPRTSNERSWLYRIRPTVAHWGTMRPADAGFWRSAPSGEGADVPPAPMRWAPVPVREGAASFLQGIHTVTTAGDAGAMAGMAASLWLCNRSMEDEVFWNADAEMLLVPQDGALLLRTEFGRIDLSPGEVAVIPRGVKFAADVDGPSRGYLCENYGGAFTLPERGPIGANCLANPRDFLCPVAHYEDREMPHRLVVKWGGRLWETEIGWSPLDVVAWHGNYAPYKYDLRRFSPVGPLLFDHADPSIFTVLTAPSETPGTANIDFVIFPDRWLVAENTFRPPWYHMNVMSEFMGLIYGQYDAKPEGFKPGGISLHNQMLPHGPDVDAFEGASRADLKPHKLEGTMAFMFETRFAQRVTDWAAGLPQRERSYEHYGHALRRHFDPTSREA
ncbi:homogentisate 1,2-dioxygenase [Sabulicella glaciei]|uniref:Homogentisate 1,2-dioxygenase n=1 Tax=Sabulicella glaciei TaxID=2984948 RepID=A0ABT3NTA2_9PROT|nr:homogentisate 1,2-dioxygenase [Roseococcus sp. MDT2-1-1]MCW8085387.1 homogentisate 1,2-dioxygenase [Roseococcus sp. MDT2-1-1]